MPGAIFYKMNCVLKLIDCVLKLLDFALKMLDFVHAVKMFDLY